MVKYRAQLMIKLERDIGWAEFSELMGIHRMTCVMIRNGMRKGSLGTAKKMVQAMRQHGIVAHLSDFEA